MQQAGKRSLGYLALGGTSILWGTTWVAAKMGVERLPPLQLSAMRQCIAGTLIVGFYMLFRKMKVPTASQFVRIFIMSMLMFIIANAVSTWSLKYISTGLAALIGALYPLNVVLIERYFFGKKEFNRITLLGFFIGLAGITIVFRDHLETPDLAGFIIGLGMALVANLAWSIGTVFLARDKQEMDANYSLGWQMLTGALVLTIIGRLSSIPFVPLPEISEKDWMVLSFLILFGSVISFSLFLYSMKALPHAIASLFAYINPIVAMLLGPLLFSDEHLSPHIISGSLITLTGVFLVNYSIRKKEEIIAPSEQ